jgi:hypothetical protein
MKRRAVCDVSDRRMPMKSEIKYNPNRVNSNAKLQQALATLGPGQTGAWPVGGGKFSEERLRKWWDSQISIHLDFPIVGPQGQCWVNLANPVVRGEMRCVRSQLINFSHSWLICR